MHKYENDLFSDMVTVREGCDSESSRACTRPSSHHGATMSQIESKSTIGQIIMVHTLLKRPFPVWPPAFVFNGDQHCLS